MAVPARSGCARRYVLPVIVDSALYRNGERVPGDHAPEDLPGLIADDGMAWIGLYRPTWDEFARVAEAFGLHPLAVEDAVNAHQRAKLERYGDVLFTVLRPARYLEPQDTVEFGEIHVFTAGRFVITVRHSENPSFADLRRELEARPDLLRGGPLVVLHALLDRVVDDYGPVTQGLEQDLDEIEDDVFDGSPMASRRIYRTLREVVHFQRAVVPIGPMVAALMEDFGEDDEEYRYLRDVRDHALRLQDQVAAFRELLQGILNVNLTIETKNLGEMSVAQNEQVKRISAWAAIGFAPTLIGTVYGMNFRRMPELQWQLGYPFALGLMAAVSLALYGLFKRRNWI